ncbi:MAG: TorF family putative porin [Rubrivivax sp.]|jgi:uncharacterized protein (TIGR02001 family)
MSKFILQAVAAAVVVTAGALPTAAVAADTSLAFNVGAVTDYRYRGISQTRLKPALQGGVDYTAGSFYVGAWGSTIQWIKDGGGKADVEIDIYGGYKFELAKGTVLDLGVLTYQYPSNGLKPSANTTEVYGALTFGPIVAKYSHSTSNLFGFAGSKGSGYLDLSGTWEVAGISVTPHIGRQTVAKNGAYSYTDYSVTLSKEISGITWSAALVDTDTKAYTGPGGKDLGKASIVLGAKYAF